ncbi:MAG: hypothetical protein J07HN6_00117 [Halonotius sp. J07HN6]|nr:MAG: hypothetical protein J07HN6_00117 [Halonotius sp. J07HN6]
MSRSDELTESTTDVDSDVSLPADDDADTGRLAGLLSTRALLISLLAVAAGVFAGGMVPLIGSFGSLAGVFVATFVVGVIASESRYVETGIAGGVATGIIGLGMLTSASLPIVLPLIEQFGLAFSGIGVAVGSVLGIVLSLVGHYFGRDLRDGLTQEI